MREKTVICFYIVVIYSMYACVVRQPSLNQVHLINEDNRGIVTLSVNGIGNNLSEIEKNACESAIKILLFEGVLSSSIQANRVPLIVNKELMQTSPLLKSFFDRDLYKDHITNIERTNYLKERTSNNSKELEYHITINRNSLRSYLERSELIRGFGY